jgi:arylsulfatase A-like enzyme
MVDLWGTILAPQPWIETHLKFYYQLQATVDEQITKVLDALAASSAYENTIVIFTSDHGDLQGSHNGMHEKWHCAYEEALHVPFVVSSPLLPGGARELDVPTSHADLIPTLLGLAGIDRDEVLAKVRTDHTETHPLIGRDLSGAIRAAEPAAPSEPILFTTDDEISEGNEPPASPFQKAARKLHRSGTIKQPNHLETVIAEVDVDGEQHLVKYSRYHDNQQFWTVPGERDERIHNTKTYTVTEPEPDEYELYDLTVDPYEERNLAHPTNADDRSRNLEARMFELLVRQLVEKRLVPEAGEVPGYRPPVALVKAGTGD